MINKNNQIKFSIIIPIYKIEFQYIKHCIDSIKSQTFNDYECILVDDQSPNEYKYYYELVKNDSRFKYYYLEHKGIPITRNRGYDLAIGELIWFIDPDDFIYDKNALEYINNAFENNKDIEVFNFQYVTKNKNKMKIYHFGVNDKFYNEIGKINSNKIMMLRTEWRNVYRKSFLDKYRIYNQNKDITYEDIYWDLMVMNYVKIIFISNKNLYCYERSRKQSVTYTNKNSWNKIKKLYITNINDCYFHLKENKALNDSFFIHIFYYVLYIPFLNKEIRKQIYNKCKKESKIFGRKKRLLLMIVSISKNKFLNWFFKILISFISATKLIKLMSIFSPKRINSKPKICVFNTDY